MKRAALILVCALAGLGCQTTPPTIGDPPPKLEDASAERLYREILERYSDTGEVYAGFDTHLFAGATYQSWAFREAKVKRLAQFKAMTEPEIAAMLAEERAEWEQFHVFDFGAWAQDPKFDDFDTKRSIWRIAMVTQNVEVLPTDVARVAKVDQNIRAVYPYMGQFWVLYEVKFPKTKEDGTPVIAPGAQGLLLRVASTLGRAELKTQVE